ncbi:MAG: SCO family protein [Rhodobacteraceae bacterium]|nr:SCO family protein [Paracoccaceae bacterium]
MTRFYAISAVALTAALLGFMGWRILTASPGGEGGDRFAQCRASAVAGGMGSVGGPFTLVDGTGATVTDAEVIDRPALVYFGYTFCPDVCPFDTARNAAAVDLLEERGIDVKPVFVTVDPERDTPEVMAEFTQYVHPRMVGLSGTPEQVADAVRAYRVYARKQEAEDAFYLVDHSTFTYLVLPGHGVVEFFRRETEPEEMAETTACFVGAS